MKITFLLTTADAMGGTERAVFLLADLLAEKHQVEVLSVFKTKDRTFFAHSDRVLVRYLVDNTGSAPRPVRESGSPQSLFTSLAKLPSEVVDPSWEPIFNRLSDAELRAELGDISADVIITSTPALLAVAVLLAPDRVIKLAQEHRVAELRGVSGGPLLPLTPYLDAMVTLTEPTRTWFEESLGALAPELAVIPNPLPEGFRPQSTCQTRTVVIAGRLVPEKQVDHAVRAFATIADRHPEWSLRVLGTGPQSRQLRQLAGQLGIGDQVQFVGSTADMPEEFAKAGLCLLTSRNEAFGLVLVEALSAGVPVVSYDCPNGPAAIVTHGVDGTLVPLDDLDGLATALDDLMSDDAKRQSFGAAGARNVRRFAPEVIAGQWLTLLDRLESERASGLRATRRAERQLNLVTSAAGGGAAAAVLPVRTNGNMLDQKAHEVRIEALHGGSVVRLGGQICLVDDERFAFEVIQANLDLAVDVLDDLGIPYTLTRTTLLRTSIAVHARHRPKFLAALHDRYRDRPVYGALLNERAKVTSTVLAALLGDEPASAAPGLRLYQPVVTTSRTVLLGQVYGCTVAFWEEEELPETGETAPDVKIVGGTVFGPALPRAAFDRPAVREVGGRRYDSIEAFSGILPDDIDFPVDAVYTWVDGSDPVWAESRDRVLKEHGLEPKGSATDNARFRSRDELRYSLRSLDMHAPWIRTIYLVTDDQVPGWLDTSHTRVKIVSHREIFGDTGRLPSFNSHAIESRLHRIEGLSEQFLYMNDDVFFGRTVTPELFFTGTGLPKFFRSPTALPPGGGGEADLAFAAAVNNRNLIEREFGRTVANTFLHTPHALSRSLLAEIDERYSEETARTAAAQLRSSTDLAIPSSLHHTLGLVTNRAVPGSIASGFVNLGLREQHPKLSRMLGLRAQDVFCLNDYHGGDVSEEEQADVIAMFLASYFPAASQFETGSARNRRHHDAQGK
ncbi:stealth conserved region 3 domain-containing protein [Streptomyces sp. SPB162]|uniref:stealth conserved region 3 domain-containing protein n=1 Tax=Streptomyces sp. SPB162 TaxID=2940560 RepID=UPI00240674C5|nr:stealth conserved region 3 domain-containing protein [Streptomyces sp. SPB162]MDF9816438.1 glycosyltransferase involved in cell wall biosynthesis [Streptomyces sp. SPB162]